MYTDHIQSLNNTEAIQTIFSILSKGHSVELPATGYSMFPAIRPGERVVVRPLMNDEIPEPGVVLVGYEKGALHLRQGFGGQRAHVSSVALAKEEGAGEEGLSGIFVMHRLIEIREDDKGNQLFITRGDSLEWVDKPWHFDQLVGIAVSKKSGNKERKIRSSVPSGLRYRINWWLLWGWGKLVSGFGFRVSKENINICDLNRE